MKNHHKPNLKSIQNKTPENPLSKIQINPKPKPPLPWNACHRHERESVRECECIEPWRLGREIFYFYFFRFEESTGLIERDGGRKRNNFFFK